MIRNVCIHVSNEQPLLCDLYDMPSATDAGLVCTNVRSMDGKRPVFIDQTASTFFFPYHVVRFLEIPEHEMAKYYAEGPRRAPQVRVVPGDGAPGTDDGMAEWAPAAPRDERDADGSGHGAPEEPGSLLPVAVGAGAADPDDDTVLEIDEGFLQRIRDL